MSSEPPVIVLPPIAIDDPRIPGDWSFYDQVTGLFVGRTYGGPQTELAANTPEGCNAIEGIYDAGSQRVDLTSGAVVDYMPPPPSPLHVWNPATRRWHLPPEAEEAQQRRAVALGEIHRLETLVQPRPVREILLGVGVGAIDRLVQIERDIRRQRRIIREADGLAPSVAAEDADFPITES